MNCHIVNAEEQHKKSIGTFICQVHFLDGGEVGYEVSTSCTGADLLALVYKQLELIDSQYFNLQFIDNKIVKWLNEKRQIKKQVKLSSKYRRMQFWFRVKLYPFNPAHFSQEFTRYLFYLQIKLDLYSAKLPCPDFTKYHLYGLAIQAEIGDYDSNKHPEGYVSQFNFVHNPTYDFCTSIARLHLQNAGMSACDAELKFLTLASGLDYYGIMRCSAKRNGASLELAVSALGIIIFEKMKIREQYQWNDILRLSCRRNKFILTIKQRTNFNGKNLLFDFKLSNSKVCKEFWILCTDYHSCFGLKQLVLSDSQTPTQPNRTDSLFKNIDVQVSSMKESSNIKMRRAATVPTTLRISSSNLMSNNNKITQKQNHFYEHSSISMTSIDDRSPRIPDSSSRIIYTALGDRSESFERALENSTLSAPARKNTPVNSTIQQTLPINTYDEIDQFKVKSKANRPDVSNFPPPLPDRDRSMSLTYRDSPQPLLFRSYYTPNLSTHCLSNSRSLDNTHAIMLDGSTKLHKKADTLQEDKKLSQLTNSHSTSDYQASKISRTSNMKHSALSQSITHQMTAQATGQQYNPIYSLPNKSKSSQAPIHITQLSNSLQMNEITPLKKDFKTCNSQHDSSSSSNSSRELNYEPDIYNTHNDNINDAVSEFRHTRQNSTEDLLYAPPTDLNGYKQMRILLKGDNEGRYGFNIQGKENNQGESITVSKVIPHSSAALAQPSLMVKDEILKVNSHSIQLFSHHQLVKFIRSGKDLKEGYLELMIGRRNNSVNQNSTNEHSSITDIKQVTQIATTLACNSTPNTPQSNQSSYVNKHSSSQSDALPTNQAPMTLSQSIELIASYLQDGSYIDTFLSIPAENVQPFRNKIHARYTNNFKKNRYKDILPYDETRVQLSIESDYINASHVEVMWGSCLADKKHYIVTQGPMKHTCKDFWCMIWDQGCSLIIMLTSLKEGGKNKCCRYWPDINKIGVNGSQQYDSIEVTSIEEHIGKLYARRKFRLRHQLNSGERYITQLHYTAWPDQGVPSETQDFISFVYTVRRESRDIVPVVHCSAGIGRSGVYIVVDSALTLIAKKIPVDLLGLIRILRTCRPNMVQNLAQFEFICRAVLSAFWQDSTATPKPYNTYNI